MFFEFNDEKIGVAERNHETLSYGFGINTAFGYFLIPDKLSFAIGVGMDFYDNPSFKSIPLFMDLRWFLKKTNNNPYINFSYGKFLPIDKEFLSGWQLKLSIGLEKEIDKLTLFGDIGYNAKIAIYPEPHLVNSFHDVENQGVIISVGLRF